MAIKKYVLPEGGSPGTVRQKDLENLHRTGASRSNAEIVLFRAGKRIARVPYSERLANRLGAQIPEVQVTKRERGEVKREILGRPTRPRALYWGELPVKQAVFWKVQEMEGISVEELVDWLIDDLAKDERRRWFWRQERDIEDIKINLGEMREDHYLFIGEGEVYPGSELSLEGESPFDIEPGPYPPIKFMRKLAEKRGRVSLATMDEKIRGKGWASCRHAVKNMAERAVKVGILNKVEEDTYETGREI
ncbi:hypothetical protein AKJ56_01115 [candidate division MSBL1 archaeon SCGC-AAA382N08]|uniref:Uncharacterized protein n=1 Tax=candidate division MSBL1 archaeon SCGC-AAA382N08 TaxID=1698285 RepID=A0A133VPY1_9EURY|nr:hypothetical protein AKJ56_01115 [candidate division MSBL1 archaeon SCGC-AAA382N08]